MIGIARSVSAVITGCALTFILSAAAQADSLVDLQAKLDGAFKGARSYVVTTSYPAQTYASTIVYVAPDRTRVAVAVSANTTEIVTIGKMTYRSRNGEPFERSATSADSGPRPPGVGRIKVTGLHADVRTGGVTYGAFETTVPLGKLLTLTCTYDKKNYRVMQCANAEVTQTYNDYDNPQNTVDAPSNAVDAPTPAPTVLQ